MIPTNPGCYLFKGKQKEIIYVGKAKNLRKRVASYFSKKEHDPKTELLISEIADTDFIVTDSEVEALILENNLIKKHQPKYNINLKDSKRYAYIEITDERFPRLIIARQRESRGNYFGPFISAANRDNVISTLVKSFMIRTCRKMPKKACLRYHIKLCSAPCIGKITESDYNKRIKSLEMALLGKTDELISLLKKEIAIASKELDYEIAISLRDQLNSLQWLKEKQKMERQKKYDEDIINYIVSKDMVYLILFNVYKGTLENKQEFVFDYKDGFLDEFILQYYSENQIPNEIIVAYPVDKALLEYLSLSKKVKIVVAKKGEKKKLLDLVIKNIEATFFSESEKLMELKDKLKLDKLPNVIECFDISHLSGTSTVASMVQFREGIADKNNYRRFKLKSVSGIDDFSSIAEVVYRRYKRLVDEKAMLPDLIVIDGGKGQLSAALSSLNNLSLKIPIIAIAKQEEDIYVPGLSFPLKIEGKGKRLIQAIRDEAHRFAISYNRLLRKKELLE